MSNVELLGKVFTTLALSSTVGVIIVIIYSLWRS